MKSYVKLMRPQHWIKNGLLFLPAFFGGGIFKINVIGELLLGFLSFSFMASVIYIINDIIDCEKDKLHEKKKMRPIASGAVSKKSGIVLAIILFGISILLTAYLCNSFFNMAVCVLALYLVINICYSKWLKNQPIIDVLILALGFVLRVMYGSIITGYASSVWLELTIMMFSFYLGVGKRRGELRKISDGSTRGVLKYYTDAFLSNSMLMFITIGIVFYAYWSASITEKKDYMVWTVPIVIVIFMKYSLDIEGDSLGDPVDVILSDPVLIILAIFYAVIVFALIYI